MERLPVALLVGPDREAQACLGSWFEGAGFEVLLCPGPSAPDFVCVGVRLGACPLTAGCDVVVLDLWLDSDRCLRGVPAHRLLDHYVAAGHAVMGLCHGQGPIGPAAHLAAEPMALVEDPPDRREVVETARTLIARRTREGG